ncbi:MULTISPECIES: MBL fold metallo-hydrolase [Pyrobaculum]|uniref:Conserved protein (Possibly metallo-beta-lactamase superfamily) n=2 Tax=Pyrobaculum aerophilum TaxID=13773 RepID=Q8ZX02_PYRAE|nr:MULTISPECIES: MBL fold metallo-hydrolase [Pyrobaculum]AAL63547.1 conserved protein (possibly metallo-beta-lactamase superfamily) [Pyrobaculum aerophilum str. IM2]MCX8136013.1 MBL fold metallo-hydrolase [Pyrobaculum aerophilum]HII46414.1 MBL fold metallo-hydrolase [Pyrobaculum aerophilum]
MNVERVIVGPLATNSYIVCEREECVVIDPGAEGDRIMRQLGRKSLVAVVATHLHFDHVGAVARLVEATGAEFYAHSDDWRIYKSLNQIAEDWGFAVPELPTPRGLGSRVWRLEVLHTPGHTPGSISLVGDGFVFTGDALFYRSVGRTDLPYGDWEALVQSVCRLYGLPPSFQVYPGHGPETTIGAEARGNPFINADICLGGRHSRLY